jgi:hypothetical protein
MSPQAIYIRKRFGYIVNLSYAVEDRDMFSLPMVTTTCLSGYKRRLRIGKTGFFTIYFLSSRVCTWCRERYGLSYERSLFGPRKYFMDYRGPGFLAVV